LVDWLHHLLRKSVAPSVVAGLTLFGSLCSKFEFANFYFD
jgi:hypothetical protein